VLEARLVIWRAALLCAVCIAIAVGAEPNQLTARERAAGWRLLFDGKTTDGWLEITGKPFPTNCWTIENGCLKAVPRKDGFQDIRTKETFGEFELEFDWMLQADGNSGVKYFVQKVDEWVNKEGRQARARGLEYQLADNHNADAASAASRVAGSLYSVIAPVPKVAPKTRAQSRAEHRGVQPLAPHREGRRGGTLAERNPRSAL
jgi:hypothetical protein